MGNLMNKLFRRWGNVSISGKLRLSIGVMHVFIACITLVSSIAIYIPLRETQTALATSTEIQRLALEIDWVEVDPATEELVLLTSQEIETTQVRMKNVFNLAMFIVISMAIFGALIVGIFSRVLHKSITQNIVLLSETAGELEAGNLEARVEIDNQDELGQLAHTINTMAAQLGNLIGGLERTVAERTAALNIEKDRLKNYLDVAAVIVVALDSNGAIDLINKRGLEILGYEEAELIGKDWFKTCLPARFQDDVHEVYKQLMAGLVEVVEFYDNPVLTKNGQERVIAWHNSILHNQAGETIGVLSSGEDITERVRTEAEIRRSNRELSALVEISQSLLQYRERIELLSFIVDEIVRIIPGAEAASLWEYDEVKAKMIPSVWTGHEDEIMSGLELDPNASLVGLVYRSRQSQNIANTQQEQAFESLDLPELDIIKSVIGVPLVAREQVIGLLFADSFSTVNAFSADDLRLLESVAYQASLALENARLFKQISGHADDLKQSVDARTEELRQRVAEVETLNRGMVNITEDIQRVNKQVKAAANRLAIANQELEAFAYSVSHDLRAPLRGIRGFAEILADRHKADLNQQGQEYIDYVVHASNQMGELIDDLLEYSRLGRRTGHTIPIDLELIIDEVLDSLSESMQQNQAEFILPPSYPMLSGDRTPLLQIFLNLFDNALKYRRPDIAPQIELSWQDESDYAMIRVIDNGIGIPEEHHHQVFTIFQRLHNDDEIPGTGIGLALVKKAVQMLNGEIRIESTYGGGTTFELKLPRAETDGV